MFMPNFSSTTFTILLFVNLTGAFRHKLSHHHKSQNVFVNTNPSAGYIFMGEQSFCSCRENVVFLNFVQYLSDNIIPYGCNGYGIRQFGDKAFNDTNLLQGYYSRDGMEYRANNWIKDDLTYNCKYTDNVTYQSTLLDMLNLVNGSGQQAYQKNAIFLQGETDTIVDLDVSLAIARQIASYNNAILYIWDHSKYGDQTGLFSILTKNQQGRIIYSNASLIELINVAKRNLFNDFASIGCGNFSTISPPTPSDPSLPTEPGYCPNIMPKYTTTSSRPTTTTTTTMRPTTKTTSTTRATPTTTTTRRSTTSTTRSSTTSTTTTRPRTTTTPYHPTSNGTCYKIVFAGEMTISITPQQKRTFLESVLLIAANLPQRLQFGITTYGTNILQNLSFQTYNDFVVTVNQLISQLPNPNSSITNVQKPYDEILQAALSNPNQKIAALVMGEMEAVRDPNAGHTAAVKIASTGTNVYVLDYSKGTLPNTLWPYITNYHDERIVNGTGKSATDIYNAFQSTLINDIVNSHC